MTALLKVIFHLPYSELYFGRGQNIATGSLVTLHWANGTKVDFHWGLPRPLPQVWKSRRLSPDKTAYIKATRLEKQWDYLATLSAHYRDGAILMRPIKGVFRQVTYEHLRPVYHQGQKAGRATPTLGSKGTAPSLEPPPSFVIKPNFVFNQGTSATLSTLLIWGCSLLAGTLPSL